MASFPAALGALCYENETTFGETTTTAATRLRPVGTVSIDPQHVGQKIDILRQKPQEGVPYVRMPMGGTLSFTLNLTGLGGTTAAAPPASALATLLGSVFGTTAASHSAALTVSGGTVSTPTATSASSVTPGSLIRIGAKGDAKGDGQWAAAGATSGSNLVLLTAIPATPASGDVIYCSRSVHNSQTTGTYETQTTMRFLVQGPRQQYLCHGCYPTAAEFSIDVGGIPTVRLTFAMAWWETSSATFPSAVAVQDYAAAPVAGGSMFLQAVGTVTRNAVVARSVSMSIGLNTVPEMGVGGFDEHQVVVGCHRGPSTCMVEMTLDSEQAGTDTFGALFDTDENSRINRHALYSMSVGDGRAVAIYWPNLTPIDKPVQMDDGGVLRKRLRYEALCGTVTTSDLTQSPWRLGMA